VYDLKNYLSITLIMFMIYESTGITCVILWRYACKMLYKAVVK